MARLGDEWVIRWGFYYETDREGDFIVLFLAQLVFAQQPDANSSRFEINAR